jgi:hypothetical protein
MPPANSEAAKTANEGGTAAPVANSPATEANASATTQTPASTPAPTPAPPIAAAAPAAPEPAPPAAKEPAKLVTELPDVAVSGRQWLRKLPDDSFVLVHKTFARVKDAQAFIKGKDYLVNARIAPVYKDDKDEARFAVMTGHFRSKERASNTISRLGLPAEVAITPTALAVSQSQLKKPKP